MTEIPIYGANHNPSGSLQTKYLSCCLSSLPSKSLYSLPGPPRHFLDIVFIKLFSLCCILLDLVKRPTNKKVALAHLTKTY